MFRLRLVPELNKAYAKRVQGFGGKARGKNTTWKTKA
jgi:hypothetical protein